MRWRTSSSGYIEALLVIPLFLGIACLVGGLGFILIQKTRLEKKTWAVQMKETYGQNVTLDGYHQSHIGPELYISQIQELPNAFLTYLVTNSPQNKRLSIHGIWTFEHQNLHLASFEKPMASQNWDLSSSFTTPGSPMKDSIIVKQKMWIDHMRKAGFDYYLLQSIGLKELKDAAVPFGKLHLPRREP